MEKKIKIINTLKKFYLDTLTKFILRIMAPVFPCICLYNSSYISLGALY